MATKSFVGDIFSQCPHRIDVNALELNRLKKRFVKRGQSLDESGEQDVILFNSKRSHFIMFEKDQFEDIIVRGNQKSAMGFRFNEMRQRTFSMPSRNTCKKPIVHRLRCSDFGLDFKTEVETYTVRSFELSSKGKIISRSDSLRSKSTSSVYSSEEELSQFSQPLSKDSKPKSRESSYFISESPIQLACRVMIKGTFAVGKTALAQQFLTSEYLGGFDTSFGKMLHISLLK